MGQQMPCCPKSEGKLLHCLLCALSNPIPSYRETRLTSACPDILLLNFVLSNRLQQTGLAAKSLKLLQYAAKAYASAVDIAHVVQGLQDAIGLSVTHSTWQRTKPKSDDEHCGWAFASPEDPPLQSSTGMLY